jgi:hypothetical protein
MAAARRAAGALLPPQVATVERRRACLRVAHELTSELLHFTVVSIEQLPRLTPYASAARLETCPVVSGSTYRRKRPAVPTPRGVATSTWPRSRRRPRGAKPAPATCDCIYAAPVPASRASIRLPHPSTAPRESGLHTPSAIPTRCRQGGSASRARAHGRVAVRGAVARRHRRPEGGAVGQPGAAVGVRRGAQRPRWGGSSTRSITAPRRSATDPLPAALAPAYHPLTAGWPHAAHLCCVRGQPGRVQVTRHDGLRPRRDGPGACHRRRSCCARGARGGALGVGWPYNVLAAAIGALTLSVPSLSPLHTTVVQGGRNAFLVAAGEGHTAIVDHLLSQADGHGGPAQLLAARSKVSSGGG